MKNLNRKQLSTILKFPLKRYGVCVFTITNLCNAKCGFCNIWKHKKKYTPDLEEAKHAIDVLLDNNIRFLQLSGGEPLLHKDIMAIIKYASDRGMIVQILTNGIGLDEKKIIELKGNGLNSVGMSIDHYKSDFVDKNRGFDGLYDKIVDSLKILNREKIYSVAFVCINRENYTELERIVINNKRIGFNITNFAYPMFVSGNYDVGSDLTKFSKKELIYIFRTLKKVSKRHKINNFKQSMDNMLSICSKRKPLYRCVAGEKVFHLNWDLKLYECIFRKKLLGDISKRDLDLSLNKNTCNSCTLDCSCFRDVTLIYDSSIIGIIKKGLRFT